MKKISRILAASLGFIILFYGYQNCSKNNKPEANFAISPSQSYVENRAENATTCNACIEILLDECRFSSID